VSLKFTNSTHLLSGNGKKGMGGSTSHYVMMLMMVVVVVVAVAELDGPLRPRGEAREEEKKRKERETRRWLYQRLDTKNVDGLS
jgi:hypothetical protein